MRYEGSLVVFGKICEAIQMTCALQGSGVLSYPIDGVGQGGGLQTLGLVMRVADAKSHKQYIHTYSFSFFPFLGVESQSCVQVL
jgi:hypothetical protein